MKQVRGYEITDISIGGEFLDIGVVYDCPICGEINIARVGINSAKVDNIIDKCCKTNFIIIPPKQGQI